VNVRLIVKKRASLSLLDPTFQIKTVEEIRPTFLF